MTEWRGVTIDDIAAPQRYAVVGGPFGSALGRKDYVTEGVPVIRGAQLGDLGAFSHQDLVFVSEDKAERHGGNLAFRGDVIVTQRGTVGQVGQIPDDAPYPRYLLSQSQMKLTVDRSQADARFVYYALLSPEVQDALVGSTISAGVPHINLATFRSLALNVPSLATQQRIAGILGALDDLIGNNRRRIELLEQMAQTIYREWFVRFRYPGYHRSALIDSSLGPIPEGWEFTSLDEAASWLSGGTPRTGVPEYWNGNVPWITSGSLTSLLLDRSPRTLTSEGVANGSRLVDRDALLFVVRGMSLVREFRVGIADVPVAFGQDCKALIARPAIAPLFLAFSVIGMANEIQKMVELAGHGTGKLSTDRLKALPIPQPPTAIQGLFVDIVSPHREMMTVIRRSTDDLVAMRDQLLPKLVSGQMDVSHLDLDALVESVA